MAGWHHWLDGHESGWTPGVGDGQGGLVCCDSWGLKESDTTERLSWTELNTLYVPGTKDHQDIKAEVIRTRGKKWQNRTLEKGSVCAQSCLTFWDPMDCSLPGPSVHGSFLARILEWVAIFSFRGSSQPGNWTCFSCISCIGRQILYHCATREAQLEKVPWTNITK